MTEIIKKKLKELEQREDVKILHCVESGSRAWGFASPDSDYDVRFIYVRPLEYYLRLEKTRDVIEWQLDETLDINGWDMQKAFRLLHNSNPTLFEWDLSPIVYKTTPEWQAVSSMMGRYFKKKAGLYHYLSTAKTNYRTSLKGELVKYKKYFYVLRPVLACKWILEHGTPPPMLFSVLMERYLTGKIKSAVEALLDIKMNFPEVKMGERVSVVNEYLDRSITELDEALAAYPADAPQGYAELNELFLRLVNNN